ncbi:hypothetical protein WA158_002971 [Blastocystis sp. Blastoise]
METCILGMPSPGAFGINKIAVGKENRPYKPQPLKTLDEYNPLIFEVGPNSSFLVSNLKKKNQIENKINSYVNRDKEFGINTGAGGALIQAKPVGKGVINKRRYDDTVDNQEEAHTSDDPQINPTNFKARNRIGIKGKGLAYNSRELNKLQNNKGGGIITKTLGHTMKAIGKATKRKSVEHIGNMLTGDNNDSQGGIVNGSLNIIKKIANSNQGNGIHRKLNKTFGGTLLENNLSGVITAMESSRGGSLDDKSVRKFFKTKNKKGKLIPPQIANALQFMVDNRKGMRAAGLKPLNMSKLRKYIDFNESPDGEHLRLKRGGAVADEVMGVINNLPNIWNMVKEIPSKVMYYAQPGKLKEAWDTMKEENEIKKQEMEVEGDYHKEELKERRKNLENYQKQKAANSQQINQNDNLISDNSQKTKDIKQIDDKPYKASGVLRAAGSKQKLKGKAFYEYMQQYCDNPIISDSDRKVTPRSPENFSQKISQYTLIPKNLIKQIYNYGYLNKPTSAVACSRAKSTMNMLNHSNPNGYNYYNSYEEFENNIDNDRTKYNMIFHQSNSDPNFGHFEAIIYTPKKIEHYSSLGNKPNFSRNFVNSHNIVFSPIQHQSTSENANGCFYYSLLYLLSNSNIMPLIKMSQPINMHNMTYANFAEELRGIKKDAIRSYGNRIFSLCCRFIDFHKNANFTKNELNGLRRASEFIDDNQCRKEIQNIIDKEIQKIYSKNIYNNNNSILSSQPHISSIDNDLTQPPFINNNRMNQNDCMSVNSFFNNNNN